MRLRRHVWRAAQVTGWMGFAAYRIRQALPTPAVYQDSEAYHAVASHPWASSALWTGTRAPGMPVLLKALGGSYAHYELVQAILACLAWGFLAWTASAVVAPGWRSFVVTTAVLGFATAPLVVEWDWSALTESPSLSFLALMCGFGLWLVRHFTWVRLTGLALAALGYVALRDADIWDMAAVGLILMGVGVLRTLRGAALSLDGVTTALRRNFAGARRPLVAGIALVAVSFTAGYGAAVSHRNVLNIEEVFYVRVFPFPDRVAWFASHGMPQAQAIDGQASMSAALPGQAKVVHPPLAQESWTPLRAWFASQALSTYILYLATNPAYVLLTPFDTPPLTYNNASGQLSFYEAPGRAVSLFETLFVPNRFVVGALAALAVVIAAARRICGLSAWRFGVLFGAVGLVSMLLAWHGEGQEVTRHMVEGSVEVRLGVLLALLFSVLGPAQRSVPSTSPLVGTPVPAVTTT